MQSDASNHLTLNVNGVERIVEVDPQTPLLFVLRNDLGLKGAKLGCGLEQCGACAVLVDGISTLTCNAPAGNFTGRKIITPESEADATLARVQEAFIRVGAAQCGYCIPGMTIAAAGLLRSNDSPTESEIREALQQHLCRCGTHQRILEAIRGLVHG